MYVLNQNFIEHPFIFFFFSPESFDQQQQMQGHNYKQPNYYGGQPSSPTTMVPPGHQLAPHTMNGSAGGYGMVHNDKLVSFN